MCYPYEQNVKRMTDTSMRKLMADLSRVNDSQHTPRCPMHAPYRIKHSVAKNPPHQNVGVHITGAHPPMFNICVCSLGCTPTWGGQRQITYNKHILMLTPRKARAIPEISSGHKCDHQRSPAEQGHGVQLSISYALELSQFSTAVFAASLAASLLSSEVMPDFKLLSLASCQARLYTFRRASFRVGFSFGATFAQLFFTFDLPTDVATLHDFFF